MADLASLKNLKWLNLGSTRITDDGLAKILELKDLEVLWLDNTDVTLVGMLKLKALPNLREVHIDPRRRDLAELKSAMPNCRFE